MAVFSKEKVNLGRQPELDLARGLAAIDIIVCHVILYLGSAANTGLNTFGDIFGSEFGAPVFMTLMGTNILYSKHQAPRMLLKRGISLLILGYALSFYRSILPLLVGGAMDEWASVEAFFVVDILQFAGLTFLFLALLKKLELPNSVIFLISVAMVLLDRVLMLPETVPWDSKVLTGLVNLFCPVSSWSCFPFLTWFFFPAFGLVFGDVLIRCRSKNRFYAVLLPVGLAGVLYVYGTFYRLYPNYTDYYFGHNFYYMGLKNVLLTALFICFALAFWYFADKILPAFARKFLVFLSRNLNVFYLCSWLVISALIHLQAVYRWSFGTAATIGMIVPVGALCAALTRLWLLVKEKVHKKNG